ncbi:hypothetical protein PENANT_c005G05678 [Penicillium antarcticum]|uniref:Major facilitator superfamily (MFS) profile domain-containing protein n=1 Tax=Penicillium antarcticum TaxID=416450 RepID=A0A1V6QF94_9EURO|nr:hypothetical protein PENANT_c005G05678 [Penicillium antarcticum]
MHDWFAPIDTPTERKLILKLDGLIIVFVFLAYWAKVLHSSATSTAYVSGIKEDLKLHVGSTALADLGLALLPGKSLTLMMTRCPVNYFLPAADLIWGVLTLAQYKASNVTRLYALRFFVGTLGGFFFSAVECMSSGYVQTGAYARLDGRYRIKGWRWLQIICFACTIPIAFLSLCLLPSTPDKCTSRFLGEHEIRLAQERMASEHREARQPFTKSKVFQILKGWRLWVLVAFAFFFSQADGVSSNSGLSLWLKAEGCSVENINMITHGLAGSYNRCISVLNIFTCIVLAIWNVPVGLKFLDFSCLGLRVALLYIIFTWANEICAHSAEEWAIVISAMNTIENTFGAWIPIFVWRTVDAPRYLIGYNWTIALDVCMIVMLVVLQQFWARICAAGSNGKPKTPHLPHHMSEDETALGSDGIKRCSVMTDMPILRQA